MFVFVCLCVCVCVCVCVRARACVRMRDFLTFKLKTQQDHGYPLRAILPGITGARQVKWMQGVRLSRKPVDAPWNAHYYLTNEGHQIQQLPLQSLILDATLSEEPENAPKAQITEKDGWTYENPKTEEKSGKLNKKLVLSVSGVAYSGGTGNAIGRVEVSVDGGHSWSDAKLNLSEIKKDDSSKSFGWVRWGYTADVDAPGGNEEDLYRQTGVAKVVYVRAIDTEGNSQFETPGPNRGYIYSGWSKVKVDCKGYWYI